MKARFNPLTFLRNLKWSCLRNNEEDHLEITRRMEGLGRRVELLRPSREEFRSLLLLEEILNCGDSRFAGEVAYCRKHGRLDVFPYERVRDVPSVEVCFDECKQLPYVLHEQKRLYYPGGWNKGLVATSYLNSVATEGLLGEGCLEKSPHNYLDERFPVKEGSVVCDFGAAEGLVALHFADRASRIVIGECDSRWLPALQATFEPYAGITTFVTEPLGMGQSGGGIAQILGKPNIVDGNFPFFLKFDIEGAERFAIREAETFFREHQDVTVACAAYHRQDDAEVLESLFKEWGYETAFSDGAMLFLLDQLTPPYFRQGVLHSRKG